MRAFPLPPPDPARDPDRYGRDADPGEPTQVREPSEVLELEPDEPTPVPAQARPASVHDRVIARTRTYGFTLDAKGAPIEIGCGRFAKAYLGEERWVESKTEVRRPVAIKVLQKGVPAEDRLRFQLEKEILERVSGHPNIVSILASGEGQGDAFVPGALRDRVDDDFIVLELMDMSLEERLKGARVRSQRDDLLAVPPRERIFRALDYIVPVATAIEYAHLDRDTCHRDIKPANILLGLPTPRRRGSQLAVKLADFNVGESNGGAGERSLTQLQGVPGTLYFQSPEQETNVLEVLVDVTRGAAEVEYFEDFCVDIHRNDELSLFNRRERYRILAADRPRKRLVLDRPWQEPSERNVRARVVKAVGRPADIYSIGALLYYLVSGAYANPRSLFDSFRKFIDYDRKDPKNTVAAYLGHQYEVIRSLRAPRAADAGARVDLAPEDRFFSYKQFLDGNGEFIDPPVMHIIARAMIRNKPDSYCQAWDLSTEGISELVADLMALTLHYGVDPAARLALHMARYEPRKPGLLQRLRRRLTGRS